MAEAHNAAALSIQLTHDGVSVSYDQELLRDIWHAFSRSYKRRFATFKNHFFTGIYPASIESLLFTIVVVLIITLFGDDPTFGLVSRLDRYLFYYLFGINWTSKLLAILVGGSIVWILAIQLLRLSLKLLLTYKGWMYENPHSQPISYFTLLWLKLLHFISRSEPMLNSFQGALPRLPLPSLKNTLEKHLLSMKPLCSDKEYAKLVELTEIFRKGIGIRLQRYLCVKSYLSINYVTEWWEEFVYLRQRSPIMVNSNYYGFDTLYEPPTRKQAARAANITYLALKFRRMVERQEVTPFSITTRYKVPFCTMQYERLFNGCRIPGEDVDSLRHWTDIRHVAVYSRGRWFKVVIHNGKRLLNPAELQLAFQTIIDNDQEEAPGERDLAALTAGDRRPWALARKAHFSSGVNKTSLHCIEQSAFCLILDQEQVFYDPADPSKLDRWAHSLLHGSANDRWFDKSFNFVISNNARFGVNVEHSWGDAAVSAHFIEYVLLKDRFEQGYDSEGNCQGTVRTNIAPERLQWTLNDQALKVINNSLETGKALINDVEMSLLVWTEFGKGMIKKLGVSPDAFLQMTLQLAYYRNQNHFCLTYEASMTRLFREGRTETVRSCTLESCAFVLTMVDPNITRQDRLALLKSACDRHQQLYRDAMCGQGIDRHLFALYVVMKYLEEESPLFDTIFPPTYLLSTSQTPLNQCSEESASLTPAQKVEFVSAGGGFGPVADRGYGISYVIAGEHQISFHISSKKSVNNTNSNQMRTDLMKSLREMRTLFQEAE